MLLASLTGSLAGVQPALAEQTVYDCRFEPGASPLERVAIRHDGTSAVFSVDASHLDDGDSITGHGFQKEGQEVEFRYEIRDSGQLQQVDTYRIDVRTGEATGSVNLYGEDGNYIRGGPLPVDGVCTIAPASDAAAP